MFSYFGLIKILSSSKQRRFATRYTSYQLIFPLRGKLKATCLPEQNIRHKTKHFKRCNWDLKMNEKPNTECILTTLQNTRNNYVHYYPKNVKLPLAVDHITHNKEMKCKLNTSQCVLTIIIVGPRMRKVGGGGGRVPMTKYPIYLPWIPPFKVIQIRLLPCTIKTIRESTLGINHNALLLYIR